MRHEEEKGERDLWVHAPDRGFATHHANQANTKFGSRKKVLDARRRQRRGSLVALTQGRHLTGAAPNVRDDGSLSLDALNDVPLSNDAR